ncbi:MAG: hypothetical protein ACRDJT_00240 [Actinomycetota bacterium]
MARAPRRDRVRPLAPQRRRFYLLCYSFLQRYYAVTVRDAPFIGM